MRMTGFWGGVWGTKATARSLKSNIASFLNSLRLQLSEEKTLITNTRQGKVKFLGTIINRVSPTRGRLAFPTLAGRLRMNVPLQSLCRRLREKGFWKPTVNGPVSQAITHFIHWPIKDIILRFRTILSGLFQYYSFVNNRGSLSYIYHLLHSSLRNTICRKLDIGVREFYAI